MRAIVFAIVALVVTPAWGEDLLLELTWHNPQPVALPATYEINAF